jgi:hypothetical protein
MRMTHDAGSTTKQAAAAGSSSSSNAFIQNAPVDLLECFVTRIRQEVIHTMPVRLRSVKLVSDSNFVKDFFCPSSHERTPATPLTYMVVRCKKLALHLNTMLARYSQRVVPKCLFNKLCVPVGEVAWVRVV